MIETVEETKLLGVVLRSDLSWSSNTAYMIGRANHKLWMLKRLKKLGAETNDLVEVYQKQVRSILEFAVPVWHSSLTGIDRMKIERVQKTAMHIILGNTYRSYSHALKCLSLDSLFSRRQNLCKTFARKAYKNSKFRQWFELNQKLAATRLEKPPLKNAYCRLERFENSPISYLTLHHSRTIFSLLNFH